MITGGKDDRIAINADSMKQIPKDNTIHLQGHVRVIFGDNTLMSDEAFIRRNTQEVEAIGNIYFTSPSAIVSGDRLIMNYKTKIGTIYNGVIKMDQVIFEGDIINKKGEREYEAVSADYSACTTCPPAWSFYGTRINATTGGYAYIKNSVLKIVKVPVFWLPYLIVPLNSKRQSGLLFPAFGYSSKSGFVYDQNFFWAIDDSTDATVTARFYQHRGYKSLLNYRYVLTEQSNGEADVGYIGDNLLAGDSIMKATGYENKKIDRWHLKYAHTYVMPHDFVHKINLKMASDLRYSRDFQGDFPGWGDPALDNRMSLTKNTESSHSSADASIYVNQLKEHPISDNSDAVHRFPELRYSLMPQKIFNTPFHFSFNTKYNNFARDGYTFDDRKKDSSGNFTPETDTSKIGIYNSDTDLIRTGQRLDLSPRISAPFSLGPYVDILPSIAYRETLYQFALGEKKSAERRLVRTDVSARTRFSTVINDDDTNPRATKYKHEVVPEITHTSIPWTQRQNHPFFGPTDEDSYYASNTALNDSDNLQFDYNDRINERNLFTFSISNYLIRKQWEGDNAQYNQIALFRLSQSFDYYESIKKSDPNQPWSEIEGLLDVRLNFFETNTLVRYYPYQNVATTAARVKGIHPRGHYLQFNYSQTFAISKGSTVRTESRGESLETAAGFVMNYATIAGKITYALVSDLATGKSTHKFKNPGYILTLRPPGNCWSITFGQEQIESGEIKYSFNFLFMFDGKNATNINPTKLY